ncbi:MULTISPECIES: GumC family protein [unclassified Sinorhizobium]|uniref:GumC family protein n=1 Tax=unclassified Sinorhizobium TaxID=2613772 RepID=UPI003526A25B
MSGFPGEPSGASYRNRRYARLDQELARQMENPARFARAPEPAEPVTVEKVGDFLELDFRRLFQWLGAGLKVAAVLALSGAIIGGAYAVLAKPRYTVSTDVLIDPALQVVANDVYTQPGQIDGQLLNAGSKLRVMTSGNVLARVVDETGLANDPEFFDPTPAFSLSGLFGGNEAAAPDPKVVALKNLMEHVSTTADEKSFVATLKVSAQTVEKAISLSKAIIASFQDELAEADAEGAGRAAAALDDRLDELKGEVLLAEKSVEDYKRVHSLSSSNGQLVNSQTMTQLNSEIVAAQSQVVAAKANYDALVNSGAKASSTDSPASAALATLINRAGNLEQQFDTQSRIYGPRHPTIVRLKAELAAINSQIQAELDRSINSAKANLDKATASLNALTAKMDEIKGSVFSDNESEIALRELERDAAAKRAVYESFLSRSRQIGQREHVDTTNVRVISTATPPAGRSWPPRTSLMVILGAFAGFAIGLFVALARGIWYDLRSPSTSALSAR